MKERNKSLPNVYGYGQIFSFSAVDGETNFYNDFVGTLTSKKVGIRFEIFKPVTLSFDSKEEKSNIITSDIIDIDIKEGNISIVFQDCHSVVGLSPIKPEIQTKRITKEMEGGIICKGIRNKVVLLYKYLDGNYKFVLCYCKSIKAGLEKAKEALNADINSIKAKRLKFYQNIPCNYNQEDESLYLKAVSILKGNIYSPTGKIPCRFTTPDRVPHKSMWLWDSVFHALGLKECDLQIAKEAIEAVLHRQRKSGFIPHRMSPYFSSFITQPPILAWGIWEVYSCDKDISFIKKNIESLSRYLEWDIKHRDKNSNGLLEWKLELSKNCRCGECGMDNSPRFDDKLKMDAIDFSSFLANDCNYLAKMYAEIGDNRQAALWQNRYDEISSKINHLLWSEENGLYYDLVHNGEMNKVASCASFLPLFCGIASKEQAEKLVNNLQDTSKFKTKLPLPSLSLDHPKFSSDMWRGSVWLNYNYMIILGLRKYGYNELAAEIRDKTLGAVQKWYNEGGSIYEFYDINNKINPTLLTRKAVTQTEPDWRKHMHAICDYGWSAAVTALLISERQ